MGRYLWRGLRREEKAKVEGELWTGRTQTLLGVEDIFVTCCIAF